MQRRTILSILPLLLFVVALPLAAQDTAPLGSVAALTPIGAQRAARLAVAAPADTDTTTCRCEKRGSARSDSTGRLRTVYSPGERFMMRSVVGSLAWIGGAYVGAYAGVRLLGTNCQCDDPGLDSALEGAAVGGIIGTTLVVSAMGYGDRCNVGSRIALAALGATLGTGLGAFLGASEYGGGYALFAIPIGGGLGGAFGAGLCTAEGPAHRKK